MLGCVSFFLSLFFSVCNLCVCAIYKCLVFFSFFFVLFLRVHKGQCVKIL